MFSWRFFQRVVEWNQNVRKKLEGSSLTSRFQKEDGLRDRLFGAGVLESVQQRHLFMSF